MARPFKFTLKRFGILKLEAIEQVLQDQVGSVEDELIHIGNSLAFKVSDRINQQPQSWPPLNPKYLREKIAKGLDERMLVATGAYQNSIGIQEILRSDSNRGHSIQVLVSVPQQLHPDAKMPYSRLGNIHEYGTEKIPARPHWGPVFRAFVVTAKEVDDRLGDLVEKGIDRDLKEHIVSKFRAVKVTGR